jgi:hypothetical protein
MHNNQLEVSPWQESVVFGVFEICSTSFAARARVISP